MLISAVQHIISNDMTCHVLACFTVHACREGDGGTHALDASIKEAVIGSINAEVERTREEGGPYASALLKQVMVIYTTAAGQADYRRWSWCALGSQMDRWSSYQQPSNNTSGSSPKHVAQFRPRG